MAGPTWVVGFLSGLVAALAPGRDARQAASRERFIADWKQRVKLSLVEDGEEDDDHDSGEEEEMIENLRETLKGLPKPLVATLLGNPSSTFHTEAYSSAPTSAYWEADVWYYPADVRRRVALAIHFEADRVSEVEKLVGPA